MIMDQEHIGSRRMHYIYIYMCLCLAIPKLKGYAYGSTEYINQLRISHPDVVIGPEVSLPVFPVWNGCSE